MEFRKLIQVTLRQLDIFNKSLRSWENVGNSCSWREYCWPFVLWSECGLLFFVKRITKNPWLTHAMAPR